MPMGQHKDRVLVVSDGSDRQSQECIEIVIEVSQ